MIKHKVLFVAESLAVGGAEKALVSILKGLDYSRLEVTLMLISKSGGFINELEEIPGLHVRYCIQPSDKMLTNLINAVKVKSIYQWLPAHVIGNYLCREYDVVVAFCEGFLTKWIGASTSKCRKIAWVHTDMVMNDWPVRTGVFSSVDKEKAAYDNFDDVIAVSSVVADGMKEKFGCTSVRVVYNILDNEIISKANAFVPDIPDAQLNLVSVGRLEYVKGYDILLEAMNILVNHRKLNIRLTLVGDGSERTSLEEAVSRYKLSKYVSFAGMQRNPYPYIANSDIFVCPSRREGFNIAILEAMTLGLPIIACNSAGPAEILDNGAYGVLTELLPEKLADAVIRFAENPGILAEFGRLSKQRANDFSPEEQIKAIHELL